MNYTMETLDNAIYKIIPKYKAVVEAGVSMNRPSMLKDCAVAHFMSDWEDRRDFDLQVAYMIVKEALVELKDGVT